MPLTAAQRKGMIEILMDPDDSGDVEACRLYLERNRIMNARIPDKMPPRDPQDEEKMRKQSLQTTKIPEANVLAKKIYTMSEEVRNEISPELEAKKSRDPQYNQILKNRAFAIANARIKQYKQHNIDIETAKKAAKAVAPSPNDITTGILSLIPSMETSSRGSDSPPPPPPSGVDWALVPSKNNKRAKNSKAR